MARPFSRAICVFLRILDIVAGLIEPSLRNWLQSTNDH